MRRLLTNVISAAAMAAALALTLSCTSSTNDGQSPATTALPPPSSLPPSATSSPTVPTPATTDIRVYFLHGDQLDVAHRPVTATPQVATAAMTELLAGPTPADRAAGLTTVIPSATRLLGIDISGGVATVDLTAEFATGGGSLSMAGRLAQVTYTLTQFPTVSGVLFHLDGKAITVFGGEGLILDHPATRGSFESLTPPILVEFPGRGWAVHTPVRIAGSANVFEAQFQAELADQAGRIIATRYIRASAGTGTRGAFDTTMAFPSSARGPATLTVFDTSARDGSRIDVVTLPVELTGG